MPILKSNKIKLIVSVSFIFVSIFAVNQAFAQDSQYDHFIGRTGFSTTQDVGSIMGAVIEGFLSLLSLIFIVLILYAGFNWMTAAGDEQKVTKAKDTITKAVIGLVIIVAAFSITYFVFNALPFGTGVGRDISSTGSPESGGGFFSGVSNWWNSLFDSSNESVDDYSDNYMPPYDEDGGCSVGYHNCGDSGCCPD